MTNRKVILITGASSGIGLVSALDLVRRGHVVYGGARRIEPMEALVKAGGHAIPLDVTKEASMKGAVRTILEKEGRIDVLVNNAGYGSYGAVEDVSLEEARRQIEVNIFGLARMTQLALPGMRAQKSGTIINISSMGGSMYTPLGAWYHATKHAVEGFSDCLRFETAPFGINVVIVAPGSIKTDFGNVLEEKVMAASGSGPYADMAQKIVNAAKAESGSDPQVIADVITRASEAARPKTRYRAGTMSRSMVYLRRLLPDRWFDKVLSMAVR